MTQEFKGKVVNVKTQDEWDEVCKILGIENDSFQMFKEQSVIYLDSYDYDRIPYAIQEGYEVISFDEFTKIKSVKQT